MLLQNFALPTSGPSDLTADQKAIKNKDSFFTWNPHWIMTDESIYSCQATIFCQSFFPNIIDYFLLRFSHFRINYAMLLCSYAIMQLCNYVIV